MFNSASVADLLANVLDIAPIDYLSAYPLTVDDAPDLVITKTTNVSVSVP